VSAGQEKESSMTTMTDLAVRPFEVHVPDDELADLQQRSRA
jgi:hypothetical protein